MGWLAWSSCGGHTVAHPSMTQTSVISDGALMIETQMPQSNRSETLLEVCTLHPEPCLLRIQSIPGQGFSLILVRGKEIFHGVVSHTLTSRTDRVRLTYNWTRTGTGTLCIEHPGDEALFIKDLTECPPMPGAVAIGALSQMRIQSNRSPQDFVAFHQGPLAIGPSASLEYHTPILTSFGYRKIGTLKVGDTVLSQDGRAVPILGLLSAVVPPLGSFRPFRLRAPYFGLQSDVVMAATQRILVGGSSVEYTFGRDEVLITAEHLVNGTAAIAQPTQGLMHYNQLILPAGEPMIASNVYVESTFLGRLRRRKTVYPHTTLSHMPRNRLPEHAKPARPVLKPFEAITLAEMRAA